ncbi:TnsA-like heteromeric transposase endonuclease subunit [Actinocrinis puniceicyclus]|uniref:TnsA-like heteromeric transposase endonuclease subunit n=1 Tax=Actinocrinis puniceicyclus TaxID=977794 RepID=A0A8J7WSD7_9ACTN|nr:TnsA-like heteromeric transposase endonuclease subunit [Actinocrinis puniceicyclus]MBS2964770.1 TnsA-like heteromeric transposase endonuclease subunit [Actinocrinis puniceicyclus]
MDLGAAMVDGFVPQSVTVSSRYEGDKVIEDQAWEDASDDVLASAVPWRTFRWYMGQKHYSGTYWSATMQDHVIYESRLELSRLLLADFDPTVRHIVAQPFLLRAEVGGRRARKHIPDYLLLTGSGPVVVDVKPTQHLAKPEVDFTFRWTRYAVEQRGWRYEVWSEPPVVYLENVRFLAGYRRQWLFDPGLLDALKTSGLAGLTIAEAARALPDHAEPMVRAAVLHLLWSGVIKVDLDRPLGTVPISKVAAR